MIFNFGNNFENERDNSIKIYAFTVTYNNDTYSRKKWYVCYYVKDYENGKLKRKQYKGEINKYNTLEERLQEIERIKNINTNIRLQTRFQ